MSVSLDCLVGAERMGKGALPLGTFAATLLDRSTYRQHQATAKEWADFERTLSRPPTLKSSGLSPAAYHSLLSEVQQITAACIAKPRPKHSDVMNGLLLRTINDHNPGEECRLVRIDDERRAGKDRCYTFGQVSDGSTPSQFAGSWVALIGNESRRVLFEIVPEGRVVEVIPVDPQQILRQSVRNLVGRGESPWNIQVKEDSSMGRWLTKLFGTHKIGFIEGYESLGVLSEAVVNACAKEKISHMLLPRGRRDPGTAPWHIGAFLTEKPGSAVGSQVTFVWEDLACEHHRQGPRLVHAEVEVRLTCYIMDIMKLPKVA